MALRPPLRAEGFAHREVSEERRKSVASRRRSSLIPLRLIGLEGRAGPSHESPINSLLGWGYRRRSGLLVAHYDHAFHGCGPLPDAALDALNYRIFEVSIFHCQQRLYSKNDSAFPSTALIAMSASLIRCRTPTFHAAIMAVAAVDWTS